jgi:putative MATE family efflux protein
MNDLTTGSLTGHLVKTTSFMLVSMVFQTLYVLIDLYWVGRLGTDAVAAVGVSSNLMFFVLAATQILGVGTTTLVAHATGRRDAARASLVFNQAQGLAVVAGLAFLVVVMAVRGPYARAFSADAITAAMAADYLLWFVPAMALQFGLIAMGAALRGSGNFKPGMVVQTVSVILNIVLAPVFIFGWLGAPAMGVVGAAIATLIAIVVGVAWMTAYFLSTHSYLRFVPAHWAPRLDIWRDLLKVGLPAGAEFAFIALYLMLVYAVSRPFGAAAQAGFGIGQRILQASFLPVVALGFAVGPVAGQNFGARNGARVRATFTSAASLATGAMLVLATITWLAAARFIGVFSADATVIAAGEEYLHIAAWNFVASGIIFVSSSMFQAMGNTVPSLLTSLTRMIIITVPVLWLAQSPGFSLRWVWYISAAAVFIQLGLNLWLLQREFRLRLQFAS